MRSGSGGGFKRLREMRPVLSALVCRGLENMEKGSKKRRGKHKNMKRVSSEKKRMKSSGAGHSFRRHCGYGRVYLEGFLQNYIVSPVPESISVTRQRQLRSLNMLPDYQLSGPDWASREHLLQENPISSCRCVINVDLISEI